MVEQVLIVMLSLWFPLSMWLIQKLLKENRKRKDLARGQSAYLQQLHSLFEGTATEQEKRLRFLYQDLDSERRLAQDLERELESVKALLLQSNRRVTAMEMQFESLPMSEMVKVMD